MSAICALLGRRRDGSVAADLRRMLGELGPFGERDECWAADRDESSIGLGVRIRDIPADPVERQPLMSADGRFGLVADARIDNREELRSALRLAPEPARRMTDAEYIMAACVAWGYDGARRLVGDFAFVLWDEERRRLFCVRDPIGQRVLFMKRSADAFAVASSIPALLAIGRARPRLDEQKVADALVLLEDARTTWYEGIERIPPGHAVIAGDRVELRRYFTLGEVPRLHLRSDGAYLEAFHEVFGDAVKARVREGTGIGVMLSAGLDSSAVAAFAATRLRDAGGRLLAFHAAPRAGADAATRDGWIADESNYVREIAQLHDNIDLRVMRPDDRTPLDVLDDLFSFVGGPIRNPANLAWVEAVHRAARHTGVRVMLSGQKGNSTISFTGLRTLRDLARSGRWSLAWRESRAVAKRRGLRPRDVFRDQVIRPLVPSALLHARARLLGRHSAAAGPLEYSAIEPDFARRMRVIDRLHERREDQQRSDRAGALGYRLLALTAGGDAADANHAMRAWFGIEARDPTSDVRVIEFCLSLPPSQFLHNGRDRLLVRRGLRGLLPASVLDRTERGAQASDWGDWFGRRRPDFEAAVAWLEGSPTGRRCLDVPRLRKLIERWPDRFGAEHITDYSLMLLRAVTMGRFIRWFEERYA